MSRELLTGLTRTYLDGKVREALDEDAADRDVTTAAVVPPALWAEAELRAGEVGVVAGLAVAEVVFHQVDPESEFEALAADGERVAPGAVMARGRGPLASLLGA